MENIHPREKSWAIGKEESVLVFHQVNKTEVAAVASVYWINSAEIKRPICFVSSIDSHFPGQGYGRELVELINRRIVEAGAIGLLHNIAEMEDAASSANNEDRTGGSIEDFYERHGWVYINETKHGFDNTMMFNARGEDPHVLEEIFNSVSTYLAS